jgi:hypothetical protein
MSSALPDRDGEDRTGKLTDDEVIEALIADCNGDARAAAMALLKLNQYCGAPAVIGDSSEGVGGGPHALAHALDERVPRGARTQRLPAREVPPHCGQNAHYFIYEAAVLRHRIRGSRRWLRCLVHRHPTEAGRPTTCS